MAEPVFGGALGKLEDSTPRCRGGLCPQDGRCACCILPRSVGGLGFDEAGVCDLCNAHRRSKESGQQTEEDRPDSEHILARVRELGRGRKYDCLVGLSGGRDSSYLLHQLVRKHGLRCLAAYYPTPFTDETIERNVQRLVKILGVPLVRMNISQDYHAKIARKVLMQWKKKPLPQLVNALCAPCKFVNREVFRIAREYDIKAIIYGGNMYEEFQFGAAYRATKPGQRKHSFMSQARRGLSIIKQGLGLFLRHPGLMLLIPVGFRSSVLYINPHTPYLRMRYSDILRVDYYYHEKYNEQECVRVITEELGWELPPGCTSYWRADCSMAEVKNLLFRRMGGASYMECYLSNMVRLGDITREEAMARLAQEGRVSEHRLAHVADRLGVSVGFLKG